MEKSFMNDTPIDYNVVQNKIKENNIQSVGKSSIRMIKRLVDDIEKESGEKFIRMEMGVPGLPPTQIGIEAEIKALKSGVAAIYPDIHGIPEVKNEISRFVKLFLDIEVKPECCIPTV
ncbi:MAG: pyridoxal phosphate-dependent aminotransferase, partial [Bacteroidales bacterium]|nr:pyridoxal phosphate-dependent aminotransferase [Bacteroidales bacterium]